LAGWYLVALALSEVRIHTQVKTRDKSGWEGGVGASWGADKKKS